MRVKCGTKFEAHPDEVQIAIDYSSSKEYPGHTKFGTNKFTKGASAATFKQVSSQLKYPDGTYECFAALMPGEGTKSKYEVIGLLAGLALCSDTTDYSSHQTSNYFITNSPKIASTLSIRYYFSTCEEKRI